jgi:DNA-binding NarL/FixJ family response regulator
MISDDQDPAEVSEGFEADANFFLYKPMLHEQLERRLPKFSARSFLHPARTERIAFRI